MSPAERVVCPGGVLMQLVRPFVLLLERFGHGEVGRVDLFVDGAGGGELLPGVRCVQVPPEVRQGLGDAEIAVF